MRGRVLAALSERPGVTIREVAERVGESPRRVRRQIEALLEVGLAEVTGEEVLPGVVQRRYGAGPLTVGEDDSADVHQRVEMAKATIRLLMSDLGVAAAAGTLAQRPNDYEVRMYGEVDDACLDHLVDLHRSAFHEIFETFEEGQERIRKNGRPGIEVVSALFFFEAPLWGPRPDGRVGSRARGAPHATADEARPSSADDPIELDPRALVGAYDHPVRRRVLTALSERPDVTIRELAERLELPPRQVRHHLGVLLEMGLADVMSVESLAGVVQRRYGAARLAVDDAGGWNDPAERLRFARAVVHLVAADFAVAARAGTLARRRDDFQVRIYGEVDGPCLERLARLHRSAYIDVCSAVDRGHERVMKAGKSGTEVVAAQFLFEAPLWRKALGHG